MGIFCDLKCTEIRFVSIFVVEIEIPKSNQTATSKVESLRKVNMLRHDAMQQSD